MTKQVKVGDKVRIISNNPRVHNFDLQTIVEVRTLREDGTVETASGKTNYDDNDFQYIRESHYELVADDKKVVKVGDKIRIIDNSTHNFSVGAIVTVKSIRKDGTCSFAFGFCHDRSHEDSQYINESQYELIEQKTEQKPVIDFTKPLQTKGGKPFTIITTDGRGEYPVVGYIGDATGPSTLTKEGKYSIGEDHGDDLENVPEKKVEHVRYYNIYPELISSSHATRTAADSAAERDRIGCKRVVFTEGEFDD